MPAALAALLTLVNISTVLPAYLEGRRACAAFPFAARIFEIAMRQNIKQPAPPQPAARAAAAQPDQPPAGHPAPAAQPQPLSQVPEISAETLRKYAAPVPRYTSYPTAPHFSPAIATADYVSWLEAIGEHDRLSLYVHIPFCDTLCWYCGCNTKVTQRYEPIARYLDALELEIAHVAKHLAKGARIAHIAWGGGSPSVLNAPDIRRLAAALRSHFTLAPDVEFAVEVDPRALAEDKIDAFAQSGVTRISIGVQDFADDVQAAINREQSFETTAAVIEGFRKRGIGSINVDLVYGLPKQTSDSVADTMDRVIGLKPDRIALFGYAHLPSRLVHQRMIDEETLPDTAARFVQAGVAADRLVAAGYVRVGLDHFALAHDELATGAVRRNFQGYTSDDAAQLIGFGASSIGRLAHGYVQNATAAADYARRVQDTGFAVVKGHRMSADDEARGLVIEQLMCEFRFSVSELKRKFGPVATPILAQARRLLEADSDGLLRADEDGFEVTEKGRLFVRTICAAFDTYLGQGTARHSAGV